MLWFMFGAVLFCVVMLAGKKPKRDPTQIADQERAAERQNTELARYFRSDHGASDEFSFPKMLMTQTVHASEASPTFQRTYHLRRVDATKWEVKQTAKSVATDIARLRWEIQRDPASKSWHEPDLAELSEAPTWLPLADEVLGGLETQYQRFLMHWKPQP